MANRTKLSHLQSFKVGVTTKTASIIDKIDSVVSALTFLCQGPNKKGNTSRTHKIPVLKLAKTTALVSFLAVVYLNILLGRSVFVETNEIEGIPAEVPYYKVSVVIMNHLRPQVVKYSRLIPTLVAHPNVDEILLLHSNPETAFQFVHPKIINYDASQENELMGLSLRFHFAQFASSPSILFVDDDMEFNSLTLDGLFREFYKNSERIVGTYGRNWSPDQPETNGYSCQDIVGPSEVVLTKIMLAERDVCKEFFRYEYLVQDIVENAPGPKWNGEDIFMSLVASHFYGKDGTRNNYAMPWLPNWDVSNEVKGYSDGRNDISGVSVRTFNSSDPRFALNKQKVQAHRSFRGKLMEAAAKRLAALNTNSTNLAISSSTIS